MSRLATSVRASGALSRKNLGKDSVLVLVVAVSAALPFLLAPLRAQVLGPSGRGEFAFFQAALTTAGMASALGLRVACYQIGYLANDRFAVSYLKLGVVSVFASMIVLVPLFWVSENQFSSLLTWSIASLVLLAPSFAMNQIEFANASFQQDRLRIGQATAVPALVEFAFSLLAFVLNAYTLVLGVFIAIFAQGQRLATAWVWHIKDGLHAKRVSRTTISPRRQVEKALLTASIKNAPTAVVPLLSGNLDVFIIGTMAAPELLGRYAVAKLGFSALLIAASIFEGRAISLVSNRGRKSGLLIILAICGIMVVLCGGAGWLLTPVVFGREFNASAQAFPVLSLAGGLSFIFVCLSAVTAHRRRASVWPGVAVLATLVAACLALSFLFQNDVVMISFALVLAQGVGVMVVFLQYRSNKGRHR